MWLLRWHAVCRAPGAEVATSVPPAERDAYEQRVHACHGEGTKSSQLVADYREAHARLTAAAAQEGIAWDELSACVSPPVAEWGGPADASQRPVLSLFMSRIDTHQVTRALAHCDAIMYGESAVRASDRIDVVLDLRDTDASKLGVITRGCSREDLRDGLRLWACIPFSVESVHVVLPHASPLLARIVARLARLLLSDKMHRKVAFGATPHTTAA